MPIDPHFVTRAAATFPQGGAPTLSATRAGLRARSAAHAAFRAAEQHLANITAAAEYDDPELAPDMKPELRTSLAAHLRQRTLAQLARLVDVAEKSYQDAVSAAAKYRPKLDPESGVQAIRTDQAWNNHIRPMLEAGKGWDQIIPTLDTDGLLAAQRFAPGYESRIRDRFSQDEVPSILAGIQAASDRRLLDLVTPEARAALTEEQIATQALQFTQDTARRVEQVDSRSAAVTGIHLKRGAFESGVQAPVDTSDGAVAAYEASLSATSVAA